MSVNNLVEQISVLSVIEILELKKALEEKWGVTAVVAAAAPAASQDAPAAEEKTSFNVMLKSAGSTKVAVIKVIKELTGLGLKESKDIADQADSIVKSNLDKATAEDFKSKLEAQGATVELK